MSLHKVEIEGTWSSGYQKMGSCEYETKLVGQLMLIQLTFLVYLFL